jgi:sensor histidine kinase YesM
VNISVTHDTLKYKIVNSKNENVPHSQNGIGVENVKKRLALIYPGKYELKMNDQGNFFVVSLLIKLKNYGLTYNVPKPLKLEVAEKNTI